MNRILVVDDSLSVRKALEKILNLHADVAIARNAEDALEQLHASKVAPDLVITDVLMPGMSGFDLTSELRRLPLTAGTPVMLMSGIIDDEVHRLALEVGASAVIRKPFTAEELLPVIRQALAGQSFVTLPDSVQETGGDDQGGEPELLTDIATPNRAAPPAPAAAWVSPVAPPVNIQLSPAAVEVPAPQKIGTSFNLPAIPAAPHTPMDEVSAMISDAQPATDPAALSLVVALTEKPGVQGAMVTTRTGAPLAEAGVIGLSATDLGMYASFFANTSSTLGERLSGGDSTGVQLEYARCTLLVLPYGENHLLICLLTDANSSSMVKFALRRQSVPGLKA